MNKTVFKALVSVAVADLNKIINENTNYKKANYFLKLKKDLSKKVPIATFVEYSTQKKKRITSRDTKKCLYNIK